MNISFSLRRLAGDGTLYVMLSLVQRGIGFLMLPILTRMFAPEEYGIIMLIANAMAFLGYALSFGLDSALTVFTVESKELEEKRRISSTVLWTNLITYGVTCAVVLVMLGRIETTLFPDQDAALALAAATVATFIGVVTGHCMQILRLTGRNGLRVSIEIILALGNAALTLALIFGTGVGVAGIHLANAAMNAMMAVPLILAARAYLAPTLSLDWLKSMLRFGLPLVPAALAFFAIGQSGSFFLNAYSTMAAVGLFSVATTVTNLLGILTTAFGQVWAPYAHANRDRMDAPQRFATVLNYYSTLLFAALCGISLFSRELLALLTPESYAGAFAYVPLMMLAQAVFHTTAYFPIGLSVSRRNYHRAWIGTVAAIVQLAGCWLLVPIYGIWGLVWVSLTSYLVFGILLEILSRRYYHIPYQWGRNAAVWILGIGGIHLVYDLPVSWSSAPLKVGAFCLLMLLPLAFGLLRPSEITTALRTLRRPGAIPEERPS